MAKETTDLNVNEPPIVEEKKPITKSAATLTLVTEWPLTDQETGTRFTQGVPVAVDKVTNWMQAQIDAGLLKQS